MTPITRIVFPIIGALIGASLGSPSTRLFDVLVGAIAGFLIADLRMLRTQLDALSTQVERLAAELRRRHAVPPESTRHPESRPAPPDPDESPDSPNFPDSPI